MKSAFSGKIEGIESEEEMSDKGRTYGEVINFYLNSLVETYKRMGYTITEISITEKNWLSPLIYEFGETESEVKPNETDN